MRIDVTYYADPQAGVHLRAGSADQDGSQLLQLLRGAKAQPLTAPALDMLCPSTSAAINLSPLRWKTLFGRLGREGSESIDQLATNVVGGRDVGGGNGQERHLQALGMSFFTDI